MAIAFNESFVKGARAQAKGLETEAKSQVYIMDRISAEQSLAQLGKMKATSPAQTKALSGAINALTKAIAHAKTTEGTQSTTGPQPRGMPSGPAVGFLHGVPVKDGQYKIADLLKLRGNDVLMVPQGKEIAFSRLGTKSITVAKGGPFTVSDGPNTHVPVVLAKAKKPTAKQTKPTLVTVEYYAGTKVKTLELRIMPQAAPTKG